eukprot:gene8983-18592_t
MSFGQFFILSPRGDSIITKDYRGDATPGMHENFFRKVKFWEKGEAPPVFMVDGITYMYIRRNSLLIACTTRYNISPANAIELLNRIAKVFKDYCGILNEDAIRKNFILLYELLDEMIDFGYPQITSTELLKGCVHNEAAILQTTNKPSRLIKSVTPHTMPSNASHKSVLNTQNRGPNSKNEVFVDIYERLNVLFSGEGLVINSSIDGSIQLKSYLAGNPELRLALNEDLIIGSSSALSGSVTLDDCNFHECVRLDEFETSRILVFLPPDGEFSVVNYRITRADFRLPFQIQPILEELPSDNRRIDIVITIRADFPPSNHATNVNICIPIPRSTSNCSFEFPIANTNNSAEYNVNDRQVHWNIRKFNGNSELSIRIKITLDQSITMVHKREIGPISMNFEIPMYNVSNLQVRYLRIAETAKAYNPYRWRNNATIGTNLTYCAIEDFFEFPQYYYIRSLDVRLNWTIINAQGRPAVFKKKEPYINEVR